jgi:hypothetical protein
MANKTEVHLSKRALDDDPDFFGAPFTGRTAPRGTGSTFPDAAPRPVAHIDVLNSGHAPLPHAQLKLWFYTTKAELRLHFDSDLLALIQDGSVLEMQRDPGAFPDCDFSLRFIPPNHVDHAAALAQCNIPLPGGARRYGWT